MPSDQIIINNFAKTSIRLDELVVPNRSGEANRNEPLLQDADEKSFGAYTPVVFVNGYYVEKYMSFFSLDMTGIIPVLRFNFTMVNPLFISVNYPKDGDIVSVYLRSWVEVYKPLRMDFNILSVKSGQSIDSEGNGIQFSVLAETRIPGLYSEVSKAFRSKTSYTTLFEVSQELNLGFSSNEQNLNDSMTWICPNLSYYDFIKEVASRSYKDDRSFFKIWIDPYYNLNFVNLNNQLTATDYVQQAKVIRGMSNGTANDTKFQGLELEMQEMPLTLTNQKGSEDIPLYISNYTLVSNSGNIVNNRGYIQEVQFYDSGLATDNYEERYVRYTIESVTTENLGENQVLQKGRPKEDLYRGEIRKNWYGTLNSSNAGQGGVHANFIQALIQNEINIDEISKFTLRVQSKPYYSGFYRGQAIPVLIYVNDQGIRKNNTGISNDQKTEEEINPVLDQFLSGIYILDGIEVMYERNTGIYQILHLRKREWTLNSAGTFPKSFPINLYSG